MLQTHFHAITLGLRRVSAACEPLHARCLRDLRVLRGKKMVPLSSQQVASRVYTLSR